MNIFTYKWASSHKVLYYCYSTLMMALVLTVTKVFVDSIFEWAIVIPSTAREWCLLFVSCIPWGVMMSIFFYISMKKNYQKGKQQ